MTDEKPAETKPEEAPSGTVRKGVSDEELRTAFVGPAFNSNKFYSSTVSAGIRLAFMEQHGTHVPPVFRTAVLLSLQDAIALRNLLIRQLEEIKPPPREAERAAQAEQGNKSEEKENG